ncbi:MAG: hypothetical protein ABR915_03295 [Thermoguttaceae bacterium]|jgi:hypothetical protein
MSDSEPPADDAGAPDDQYRLAPPDPGPGPPEPRLPGEPVDPARLEPPPKERFQFSISDLLLVTAAVSLLLSITGRLVQIMPGGPTPANFAGVMGLGALACMIVLALIPQPRGIILLGWWVLSALYVMACAMALLTHG